MSSLESPTSSHGKGDLEHIERNAHGANHVDGDETPLPLFMSNEPDHITQFPNKWSRYRSVRPRSWAFPHH